VTTVALFLSEIPFEISARLFNSFHKNAERKAPKNKIMKIFLSDINFNSDVSPKFERAQPT
jgi:hypothetical protein